MLTHTVGIQERTVHLHNGIAPPFHNQPWFLGDFRHFRRFEVFFISQLGEFTQMLGTDNHSHALLRFGDGQFRAVKALVLFLHRIQIDGKARSQFADSHGHTARTKVVAALNHAADNRIAEQALNLALRGRIALLHFGTAGGQGFFRMFLRGTGGPAAAITAGTPAHEHDDITGSRHFPYHIGLRCSGDYRADFHALGHVAFVVNFPYLPRSQTNLVAVGAVASSSAQGDFLLGQFARQGVLEQAARVSSTGDAHGLIDIGTAGQRVADSTAQTGSGTTERLDFRRMVVGFILEHHQPILFFAVDICFHHDGAGIDFLRFIQVCQLAVLAQGLHADNRNIHQRHITVFSGIEFFPVLQVFRISLGNARRVITLGNLHFIHRRSKGGMTAVVGPICINYSKFCNGRRTLFRIPEVNLAERHVRQTHGKALGLPKILQSFDIQIIEVFQHFNISRLLVFTNQGFRLLQAGLTAFHLVDAVILYFAKGFSVHITDNDDNLGHPDFRAFLLGNQLHALGCRVRRLVILPR